MEKVPDQASPFVHAVLALDESEYHADLAEFNLTPQQESELLQALWNIMRSFVELGWGVDSIQQIFPVLFDKDADADGNLLERIEKDAQGQFNRAASAGQGKEADDA